MNHGGHRELPAVIYNVIRWIEIWRLCTTGMIIVDSQMPQPGFSARNCKRPIGRDKAPLLAIRRARVLIALVERQSVELCCPILQGLTATRRRAPLCYCRFTASKNTGPQDRRYVRQQKTPRKFRGAVGKSADVDGNYLNTAPPCAYGRPPVTKPSCELCQKRVDLLIMPRS
jgi:hypothetical protein